MEEKIWWLIPNTLWVDDRTPKKLMEVWKNKWRKLEEPRVFARDSYNISISILEFMIDLHLYSFASIMISLVFVTNENRNLSSTGDIVGLYFYNLSELELAREAYYFTNLEFGRNYFRESYQKKQKMIVEGEGEIFYYDILKDMMKESPYYKNGEEENQKEVLDAFLPVVIRWRDLSYPKIETKECYEIVEELITLCIQYKTYKVAGKLIVFLFMSDRKRKRYGKSSFLGGILAYEQGAKEVAKQLFYYAGEKSDRKCFEKKEYKKYEELAYGESLDLDYTEEVKN